MALALALGTPLAACGGEPADCVDADADGYGEGCVLGPDCDDDNAARNIDCERVPPPDCGADPFATGCPCLAGARAICYSGPPETRDVGPCRGGRALCISGHWGICDGAVVPRGEVCDGQDQDCDGFADNGVLSPCGGCEPGCNGGVWGESDAPFTPGAGLDVGAEGELTLAHAERLVGSSVWVANSGEGTISKIDAATAIEVARYATGGSEPSRVAVDYLGDAWVANREFDGVSSVTKIAGERGRCVDVDGGGITTSTGPSDVLPFGEDECVLFRTEVGGVGEVARALAIDGDLGLDGISGGNAWVGLHDGQALVVVEGSGGEVIERIETPGLSPYASAFDAWGTLWLSSRDGYLASINRAVFPREPTLLEVPLSCYLLYSLTVDGAGHVIATGFSCDDVVTYDPLRDLFRHLPTPASPRGISVGDGDLFVAHTAGRMSRIAPDGSRVLETVELASADAEPFESIGVGVDGFGQVWIASSQGGAGGVGVATRLSADDGSVIAQVPVGLSPHTTGDLTGAELRGGFESEGQSSHVFEGCFDGDTEWLRIHVSSLAGASGSVEVSARHAASAAALSTAAWVVLGSFPTDPLPYALDFPDGGVVEVRLVLRTSDRDGAPRVQRLGLEWFCPGPM